MSERELFAAADMEVPRYPERDIVRAGECGRQPLKDLVKWAQGDTFHPYAVCFYESRETFEEAHELMRDHPAVVKYESQIASHHTLDWSLLVVRAGDPEARVFTRPHMTPEDAAYHALTLIEEHERECYTTNLVAGLA